MSLSVAKRQRRKANSWNGILCAILGQIWKMNCKSYFEHYQITIKSLDFYVTNLENAFVHGITETKMLVLKPLFVCLTDKLKY